MKILNFRFRLEQDPRDNARAIRDLVNTLRTPSVPDVLIAPLISPPPEFSGISLSGDSEAITLAADRLRQWLVRQEVQFREEDASGIADPEEDGPKELPIEGFAGITRDGEYGFAHISPAVTDEVRDRWKLDRQLKSGIRFYRLGMFEDARRQLVQVVERDGAPAEAWHYLGLAYEQEGRLDDSLDALRHAIDLDPEAASSLFYLANVEQKRGNLELAIDAYKRAIELDPDVPVVYNNLGWVFYQMGEHEKAVRSFEEAISIDPELPFAHNGLACVHQDMGNLQDAIHEFKQAIEHFPDYAAAHLKLGWAYLLTGDVHSAIESLKNAAHTSDDPQYSMSAHYSLGHAYLSLNQVEDANKEFEKVLLEDPDFSDALFHSGETLVRLNRFDEAVDVLLHYLQETEEQNPEVYKLLASAYFHLGRFRDASQACKEALKKGPADPEIFEMMGNIAVSKDRWKDAEKNFQKALMLNPQSAFSHFQLGWINENTDRIPEAIDRYKKAIQVDPEATEAYNNLGWIYTQQGKNEEALVIFEKALEISPEDEDVINNLAWTYSVLGNYEESLTQYRRGMSMNPDSATLQSNLGIVYYKMGIYDRAEREIERSLDLSGDESDYAVAHYYLGLLKKRDNRFEEAMRHFHQAVKLDPDYSEPYFPLAEGLVQQGKTQKAAKALQQYLKLSPKGEFAARANQILDDRLSQAG